MKRKFIEGLYKVAEVIEERNEVSPIDLRQLAEHGMPLRLICKCINPEVLAREIDNFACNL